MFCLLEFLQTQHKYKCNISYFSSRASPVLIKQREHHFQIKGAVLPSSTMPQRLHVFERFVSELSPRAFARLQANCADQVLRCSCRASAGRASCGEEEDGYSSVRSALVEKGRPLHCPEKCTYPVETTTELMRLSVLCPV